MTALAWEGCLNVRDLGGHPTEDGGVTRFRAIVRADSVSNLSDAGWRALADYGVSRVVDLRFHDEREADPPRDLPVEVIHLSLLGERDPAYFQELDARVDAAADGAEYLVWSYLDFLERYRRNFARAIGLVAEAPPGAVVVHCLGGKDRTGLVCALLLRLAGVPRKRVAEDYAASEQNLAPMNDRWVAEATTELERRRRSRIAEGPARVMLDVVAELEERHGSVAGYLRAAGADEEQLARARGRLRG